MRIALIGTHCSGKTTLLNLLKKESRFNNYSFKEEPIRVVSKYGFEINEKANDESQLAMLSLHLMNLQEDNFISDRSLLDLYIYVEYLNRKNKVISQKTVDFIKEITFNNLYKYDYLFYCMPEFGLDTDGFRSLDKEFQDGIHKLFIDTLHILDLKNVYLLKGNSEDRLKELIKTIEEKLK